MTERVSARGMLTRWVLSDAPADGCQLSRSTPRNVPEPWLVTAIAHVVLWPSRIGPGADRDMLIDFVDPANAMSRHTSSTQNSAHSTGTK